jgi:hypothetical protein
VFPAALHSTGCLHHRQKKPRERKTRTEGRGRRSHEKGRQEQREEEEGPTRKEDKNRGKRKKDPRERKTRTERRGRRSHATPGQQHRGQHQVTNPKLKAAEATPDQVTGRLRSVEEEVVFGVCIIMAMANHKQPQDFVTAQNQ